MDLPVNFYTQWYWKVDLHNLLHFLKLRTDSHAQYEIRVYADIIASIVEKWVPVTTEAYRDYYQHGCSLSRMEMDALRALLSGQTPDLAELGLSGREQREFCARFELDPDTLRPLG